MNCLFYIPVIKLFAARFILNQFIGPVSWPDSNQLMKHLNHYIATLAVNWWVKSDFRFLYNIWMWSYGFFYGIWSWFLHMLYVWVIDLNVHIQISILQVVGCGLGCVLSSALPKYFRPLSHCLQLHENLLTPSPSTDSSVVDSQTLSLSVMEAGVQIDKNVRVHVFLKQSVLFWP